MLVLDRITYLEYGGRIFRKNKYHSSYCDEKYVRFINADLNEWINKLLNNKKKEIIEKKRILL